ncbi:MAG: nuclear transport factor 2 family protein [Candidatus Omnitrophica bacterium]|nr:nuclear transport factor 2 family protein [Candidatus Omnitrophota bacterium]MDD5670733.1 nuclear transport factor 2 family protein [Candidatus Omnitrophota bacterium]
MKRNGCFHPSVALAILILGFIGLMFSGAEVLRAELDPAAIQQDIQTFFDRLAMAFDKKDIAGIVQTAMPDASLQSLDGSSMTLEQWKTAAEEEFPTVQDLHSLFIVETAKVVGDQATVTYTETHRYELIKEPGQRCESLSRWRADLLKTPEGWRIKSFAQLDGQILRDGKPAEAGTLPKTL